MSYLTSAIRALHDDVASNTSRPAADEICARLLAIEALAVADEVRSTERPSVVRPTGHLAEPFDQPLANEQPRANIPSSPIAEMR